MVFPVYDDNPFRRAIPPYVTWGLIILNAAVFLFEVGQTEVEAFIASFGAVPASILHKVPHAGAMPAELTLVTSLFLHGGWEHLLGNMIYLWVFGDDIEDALGRLRFLAFYLLCGIGATLAFVLFNPNSRTPLVGASGAISGVLAAYLMLRPCAKVSVFVFRAIVRMSAFWVIGAWVLLQVWSIATSSNDGVAYLAHLGGLVFGGLLFLVMRPKGVELFECMDERSQDRATAA